jgi:proteasome activator subunit 4
MDEEDRTTFTYNDDIDSSWEGDTLDNQLATLKTYLNHIPYQCESLQEMNAKLEEIIGKIAICAKSRNWYLLTQWDTLLSW